MIDNITFEALELNHCIKSFVEYCFENDIKENTWEQFFEIRDSYEFTPWRGIFGAEIVQYDTDSLFLEVMYLASENSYDIIIEYELPNYNPKDKPDFSEFKIVRNHTLAYYNKIKKLGNMNAIFSFLCVEDQITILDFKNKYSRGDSIKEQVIDLLSELEADKFIVNDKLYPPMNFKNDFYTLIPFEILKRNRNVRYLIMYKYDEKSENLKFSVRYQSSGAKNVRYLFRDVPFYKFYEKLNSSLCYGTKGKELFTALNAAIIKNI